MRLSKGILRGDERSFSDIFIYYAKDGPSKMWSDFF